MIPYANRQRNIARLALQAAGAHSGFALAGSGAIREHGLIDRPTEDVDLFTVQGAVQEFGPALDRIVHRLPDRLLVVIRHRSAGPRRTGCRGR